MAAPTQFSALTRARQTRRMLRLARTALAACDVLPTRVSRLPQGYNATFRLDAASSERFVLRVHRPDGPTHAMVRSELTRLAALRGETDLVVPEPVRTRDGELLTTAAAAVTRTAQL
jgi:Ser/Thr protein kinase RdoA (MazF antagonist)